MIKTVALLLILCASTPSAAAEIQQGKASPQRFAQSDMCTTAAKNARTCHDNWRSMGRGSTGQAGSFRDCFQVYCNAMIAAGCQTPQFC